MPSSNPNSKPSRQSAYRSYRRGLRNPATTFSIGVDLDALDAEIDRRSAQLQANVRPAAQAGAEVLYQGVLRNVRAIGRVTGNLESSIYQAFSARHSLESEHGYAKAVYQVSWNPRKAPHAHLVEFGHWKRYQVYFKNDRWYTDKSAPLPAPVLIAARPFVRPAMALFPQAQEAMEKRLLEGVT